jgi:hypothetical protein
MIGLVLITTVYQCYSRDGTGDHRLVFHGLHKVNLVIRPLNGWVKSRSSRSHNSVWSVMENCAASAQNARENVLPKKYM